MALSKEELEKIEKEFAKEFERNPEKMIAKYREAFGNYLCNDNALELCPTYKDAPNEQKRSMADSMSVRQTAGGIVYKAFDQMLKEAPKPGVEDLVTFVAGGAGSGKTYFIKENKTLKQIINETSQIVFEVVRSFEEANIERALNAGKTALMLFVYRPIEAAARGALTRGEEIGRVPNFDYLCSGHLHCQREMKLLAQTYQHNESVIGAIGDNRNEQKPRLIEPNTKQTLEFLQNNDYKNSEDIKSRAFHSVQKLIKDREKEGKPIDQNLVKYYIGKEQEGRREKADQLSQKRERKEDERERNR